MMSKKCSATDIHREFRSFTSHDHPTTGEKDVTQMTSGMANGNHVGLANQPTNSHQVDVVNGDRMKDPDMGEQFENFTDDSSKPILSAKVVKNIIDADEHSDILEEKKRRQSSHGACSENGRRFLGRLLPLMMQEVTEDGTSVHKKVVEFEHPETLLSILDLELSNEPCDEERLLDTCRQIIDYSVKTGHPRFFNQLFGGLCSYGVAGSWMTESLNTSAYTYEVSPVFSLMERVVLAEMLRLVGFSDGDAIFCPGGSVSNMYAINLARHNMFPSVKRSGLSGLPPLCILTSEKGHYSILKGAAFLGLGINNVIKVKADCNGRMTADALEAAVLLSKEQGRVPFMVNATEGSTVLGSFDPLRPIHSVCRRFGLWLHADSAWGGAVLLSGRLRHKMTGVELCDSVTWNPHKMMGVPMQCSAFLTRHKKLLFEAHSVKAEYLFQQDKFYDVSYDTGDKSIQCGRKVDCLKLWMMWKVRGTAQFAEEVENLFRCARYLTDKLKSTEGYRLVIDEPECTNVCFWYIPPSLRGLEPTPEWWEKLSKVAPTIKQRMMLLGTMLVGYQPDGELVNFFRMVISNTSTSTDDMDFVVTEISRLGSDL